MGIPPFTPVPTIDLTGIHVPDFTDVLAYFKLQYQSIYGTDTYLENDSQDGQLLSLFALAVDDLNSAIEAAYNGYSPSTAQGAGLSSNVKINGIARKTPTYSTADIYIVGVAGTIIDGGYVLDINNNPWNLPDPTVIGPTGDNTVTATCGNIGAIRADPNTINIIGTPTLGWQTATNPNVSNTGGPLEPDGGLRIRQAESTMLPSQTVIDGIQGELYAISGVTRVRIYENDTDTPETYNTVSTKFPPHSISCVVDGGDSAAIVDTIGIKKTPGAYTNGTTAIIWTSPYGIPQTIRFSRPKEPSIQYQVELTAFAGFTTDIQQQITDSLVAWTNSLGIGTTLEWIASLVPAQLWGQLPQSTTYEINSLRVGIVGQPVAQSDIPVSFDSAVFCDPNNITFNVHSSPAPTSMRVTSQRRPR